MKQFVLFEHATGYALFKIIANEVVGTLLEEVQKSINELDKFGKVTKLIAYAPFKSASDCLENSLAICDGILTNDLIDFIKANIKVSSKITLGVSDTRIGCLIQEKIGITCINNDVILEIMRGLRLHFHKMIEGINYKSCISAQLGLGHSISRTRLKYNVKKADNMVIQSISLIDQLDKDINTFSMRIREWYSYHYPELYKIINDNYLYAKIANYIGDRTNLSETDIAELASILNNEELAKEIYESSKTSIGMDISEFDLLNIKNFSLRVISLVEYRQSLFNYLVEKMNLIAPNLSSVIGEIVGAKLIAQSGSLSNLAKCPASTVQILGAEKAVFRALKTRGKTPKYGIIYHSSFIGRAPTRCKGRISRLLAHKCSIASRLDCFSETPSNIIGIKLNQQLEDRLEFYHREDVEGEGCALPRKNADVMKEALLALKEFNNKKIDSDPTLLASAVHLKDNEVVVSKANKKKLKQLKKKLKKEVNKIPA